MGLMVGALNPLGRWARASNLLLASLWLGFTILGFRAAQQRRIPEHRRWMLRSVVLTLWLGRLIPLVSLEWWLQGRRPAAPLRAAQ